MNLREPSDPQHAGGDTGFAKLRTEVDLASGCDQGGSIRIPASYCGIVGLKPTHGLVPYTGILGMDATIDHVGPMSATVADNALLLSVIAGEDGWDGRQRAPRTDDYVASLGAGCQGLDDVNRSQDMSGLVCKLPIRLPRVDPLAFPGAGGPLESTGDSPG